MTAYIKQLIDELDAQKIEGQFVMQSHVAAIAEELDRLDPREFEPSARAGIVQARANLTYFGTVKGGTGTVIKGVLDKLRPLLDQYRGEGSGGIRRSFAYIADADLRKIIERDYIELANKVFPDQAWKSTVIIAGSILEAILFAVLSDPKRLATTNASTKGAKAKGGVPIDITVDPDAWKLIHLIEVAVDIGVLPKARADTIDQVLRDYRNFVHPKKELKAKHECTESEAGLAKYGLDGVCDHLEKTLRT
jgi:hypothetical protein